MCGVGGVLTRPSVQTNLYMYINFQKSRNGLNDHKRLENINYAILRHCEMFYGCHMALTLQTAYIS